MSRRCAVHERITILLLWPLLCALGHAAEKLHPVDRELKAETRADFNEQTDADRERERFGPLAGPGEASSQSEVDCARSSAATSSLIDSDVARIVLQTELDVLRPDAGGLVAQAEGHVNVRVESASRKFLSFDHQSIGAINGSITLSNVSTGETIWNASLQETANLSSVFGVRLPPGEYQLSVVGEQVTTEDAAPNTVLAAQLRVSLVNRGDVNGNQQFDAADKAVVSAIVNSTTFSSIADLDDDGDNDAQDHQIWDSLVSNSRATITALHSTKLSPDNLQTEFLDAEVLTCKTNVSSQQITPGDANGDGLVEFKDFLIVARHFGLQGGLNRGDFDGDGKIQFPDFLILSRNFGRREALMVVPEPSTTGIVGLTLCWLLLMHNRKLASKRKTLRN